MGYLCQECVARAANLPIAGISRQEKRIAFAISQLVAAASYCSFAAENQHAEKSFLVDDAARFRQNFSVERELVDYKIITGDHVRITFAGRCRLCARALRLKFREANCHGYGRQIRREKFFS